MNKSKEDTVGFGVVAVDTVSETNITTITTSTTNTSTTNKNQNHKESNHDNNHDMMNQNNIEKSTILLLEHINLNIPHPNHAIQLYIQLFGCGYDPRRFQNVISGKGTIWANGGRTQFHLPYGIIGQSIIGKIGIRIHSNRWYAFQQRISSYLLVHTTPLLQSSTTTTQQLINHDASSKGSSLDVTTTTHDDTNTTSSSLSSSSSSSAVITAITKGVDRYQNEYIEITDQYQNVFYCRPNYMEESSSLLPPLQQPIVTRNDPKYIELYGTNLLNQYIPYESDQTDCCGIDFIEFHCPIGTADKIATFYNACFDVPVHVVEQDDDDDDNNNNNNNNNNKNSKSKQQNTKNKKMAIIAIGNINITTGRTDQSLLFREVDDYETTRHLRYNRDNENDNNSDNGLDHQYHIAIYVGETIADFQHAYRNCDLLDLIYINPRFSDRATTIELATHQYQQFRIKYIVDIESANGDIIMELEHEIRSIHHEAWIGEKVKSKTKV